MPMHKPVLEAYSIKSPKYNSLTWIFIKLNDWSVNFYEPTDYSNTVNIIKTDEKMKRKWECNFGFLIQQWAWNQGQGHSDKYQM